MRSDLSAIWRAGVDAVQGAAAVNAALAADPPFSPDLIIAVGKAAGSMCAGALESLPVSPPALVITPRATSTIELADRPNVSLYSSSHPLPDAASLVAGQVLLDTIREQNAATKLLLLVSGGASALVEVLTEGVTLDSLRARTAEWLAGGLSIAEVNVRRTVLSRIKGGKLLREFAGAAARVYAISDVEGDDIALIGSGIGDVALARCPAQAKIIASNRIARAAAAEFSVNAGYMLRLNEESLYGDVGEVAERIIRTLLSGQAGSYIWGGEPVVQLPEKPGIGGRNQSLALSIAMGICAAQDISVLAAGTDGIDGQTDAAGGIVDTATVDDPAEARRCLDKADAGRWLSAHGAAFVTGPTNTNVMDLVVAIVGADGRA